MNASLTYQIVQFAFASATIDLVAPDLEAVRAQHARCGAPPEDFPFWAKVWPSAIAMCRFLEQYPAIIQDKKVLELAAGLGLPSMLAARWADSVVCSDSNAAAVACMQASAALQPSKNIESCMIDWNAMPDTILPEVVLLSDVNYAADQLQQLLDLIQNMLLSGTTVLLTTPARMVARSFISQISAWTTQRAFIEVAGDTIHMFVLQVSETLIR